MGMRIYRMVGFAAFFALMGGCAQQFHVTSAQDIERLGSQAKPGDVLVMADGDWKDQVIHFKGKGSGEKPITLRAQTPGKVRLVGASSILVEGDNLVVSGVSLDHSSGEGDGIVLRGDHNRLTESSIVQGKYKFFVHLFGSDNRVDHCY